MHRAGTPPHTWLAGTDFVTTEPAAITEFSPTSTPGSKRSLEIHSVIRTKTR